MSEMGDLSNYVVENYEDVLDEDENFNKNNIKSKFNRVNSDHYLGNESDFITYSRYIISIIKKIYPTIKRYENDEIGEPFWDGGFIYLVTRLVHFTKTESGYWGIEIKHPTKGKKESVFIKLAESDYNDKNIKKIIESGSEDTFTCEIYKNGNGKWMLSAKVNMDDEAEETPDDEEVEHIVGVDLGLRNVAVATVLDKDENIQDVKFFRGENILKKRKELNKRMSELQEEGNKKAYNRLKDKDGKMMELKNHEVSKSLVEFAKEYKPCKIVFEDLQNSKDDMKEESFKESGDIKGSAGRYKNRLLSFWSPYMLKEFTEYKAEEFGISVKDVDPKHTSQTCPKCDPDFEHPNPNNRKSHKHTFKCEECGYEINDDLVGAINIARRGGEEVLG